MSLVANGSKILVYSGKSGMEDVNTVKSSRFVDPFNPKQVESTVELYSKHTIDKFTNRRYMELPEIVSIDNSEIRLKFVDCNSSVVGNTSMNYDDIDGVVIMQVNVGDYSFYGNVDFRDLVKLIIEYGVENGEIKSPVYITDTRSGYFRVDAETEETKKRLFKKQSKTIKYKVGSFYKSESWSNQWIYLGEFDSYCKKLNYNHFEILDEPLKMHLMIPVRPRENTSYNQVIDRLVSSNFFLECDSYCSVAISESLLDKRSPKIEIAEYCCELPDDYRDTLNRLISIGKKNSMKNWKDNRHGVDAMMFRCLQLDDEQIDINEGFIQNLTSLIPYYYTITWRGNNYPGRRK